MHPLRHLVPFALLLFVAAPQLAAGQEWTLRVDVDGEPLVGWPAAFDAAQVLLMERDGQIAHFPTSAASNYERISNRFTPYSSAEMRSRLSQEFAGRLVVSAAGNYLVAHPPGERDLWPTRFDELYRSFMHYFTARGLRPARPEFPLVAVVFPNRNDFIHQAALEGVQLSPGMLGYYSPRTNRVLMYDFTEGSNDDAWYVNADTIIHEAAHQAAFNTGIHNRLAMPPKWVAEGLGTLFEARGVWDSRRYPAQSQRVNQNQLAAFRDYVARGRPADSLAQLINSDRPFNTRTAQAYAEAWALAFYLSENEPRRWCRYLERTAELEPLADYTPQDRMRDFTEIFGNDLRMLDARLLRFIEGL